MIEISATARKAAALVTAVATIGAGAIGMDTRHVSQVEFNSHVSSNRVRTILDLTEQSQRSGAPTYLCRALDAEFAALCTEQPRHYFCDDPDTKREIMAKAGCQ